MNIFFKALKIVKLAKVVSILDLCFKIFRRNGLYLILTFATTKKTKDRVG